MVFNVVVSCLTGTQPKPCIICESTHPDPEARPSASHKPVPATCTVIKFGAVKYTGELDSG